MFYKCHECGHIFEEGEETKVIDTYGLDFPPYEKYSVCPVCGESYGIAKRCEECGGLFLEDELTEGICEECCENTIEEYSFGHIDELYLISSNSKEPVELNKLIAYMFSEEQINQILFNVLKEQDSFKRVDCKEFLKDDSYWSIEKIKKQERG